MQKNSPDSRVDPGTRTLFPDLPVQGKQLIAEVAEPVGHGQRDLAAADHFLHFGKGHEARAAGFAGLQDDLIQRQVIRENAYQLEMCRKYGHDPVLIDGSYHVEIDIEQEKGEL